MSNMLWNFNKTISLREKHSLCTDKLCNNWLYEIEQQQICMGSNNGMEIKSDIPFHSIPYFHWNHFSLILVEAILGCLLDGECHNARKTRQTEKSSLMSFKMRGANIKPFSKCRDMIELICHCLYANTVLSSLQFS